MKAGFHWICEVARCCGRKYVRKRLPGRTFTCMGQVCIHCGQGLAWNAPEPNKVLSRDGYRQRAAANRLAGLTAHGAPRRRQPLSEVERLYLALKAEIEAHPQELPLATGFRDAEINERFRARGRAGKAALEAAELDREANRRAA